MADPVSAVVSTEETAESEKPHTNRVPAAYLIQPLGSKILGGNIPTPHTYSKANEASPAATSIMGSIRRTKTKRRTRDLDQVHADLKSRKHLDQFKATKAAEDLPGLGQWYCVECAKWFEGEHNLVQHRRGKNHKRRVRLLRENPYTQKEAEAAAGLGANTFYSKDEDPTDQITADEGNAAMEIEPTKITVKP